MQKYRLLPLHVNENGGYPRIVVRLKTRWHARVLVNNEVSVRRVSYTVCRGVLSGGRAIFLRPPSCARDDDVTPSGRAGGSPGRTGGLVLRRYVSPSWQRVLVVFAFY